MRLDVVAISGGASASFQYDPFGRRVSKTIGGTTQYLYDGANPVQEISGTSASANLLTGGVDEYFQRTDSAGARDFLTDALGSTIALADSTGTVQTQYAFEPFGNTTATGAPTPNSFDFTGRELDLTGLYFYRARYYSSALARFVSEDPLGFGGGDVNLYAYAGDDPINFADPLGLYSWDGFLGDSSNVIAGAGDTLSFGLSAYARNQWGDFFYGNTPRTVNTCSGSYKIGIGVGIGLSSAIGAEGLPAGLSGLSNGTKGAIGEGLSFAENTLEGSTNLATRTRSIPGFRTMVDSTWESARGEIYYVESKFGTSGLTAAQRAAAKALPDQYQVERWGYDFFGRVGGYLGFGYGAAGAMAGRKGGCN